MNEIKDGGPAFPCHTNPRPGTLNEAPQGMTLRDYFAAHAPDVPDDFDWAAGETDSWQRRARWSFHYADAMLRARGEA
ncbi:hypothetical protein [Burkholderia vietnamiensis]|uniref:hypothetical protein n=1 Tax=Burkholderia vietnamiensis TaxID=60552 RepID=UPI001CF29E2B|nr:hypothetical protein [Burkholderia vietnamiensis]MCA8447556.1 hypothetical protein [Burkholderia vietnamiensis]MDN7820486.1 hypothetical protein [Burkholderia vietnamiensis]HDR9134415.1 hypothetical protein [Burkholderia vietnamiensis]